MLMRLRAELLIRIPSYHEQPQAQMISWLALAFLRSSSSG
jgi:hypothetical protein